MRFTCLTSLHIHPSAWKLKKRIQRRMEHVEEASRRKQVRGIGREPRAPEAAAANKERTVSDSKWNCRWIVKWRRREHARSMMFLVTLNKQRQIQVWRASSVAGGRIWECCQWWGGEGKEGLAWGERILTHPMPHSASSEPSQLESRGETMGRLNGWRGGREDSCNPVGGAWQEARKTWRDSNV